MRGLGTDQDLDESQRLYFVNMALGSVNEGDQCYPKQIQALFLNKRKNEWISRFMGYGIMYLLVSGLSIVMSVLQYKEVKKNVL